MTLSGLTGRQAGAVGGVNEVRGGGRAGGHEDGAVADHQPPRQGPGAEAAGAGPLQALHRQPGTALPTPRPAPQPMPSEAPGRPAALMHVNMRGRFSHCSRAAMPSADGGTLDEWPDASALQQSDDATPQPHACPKVGGRAGASLCCTATMRPLPTSGQACGRGVAWSLCAARRV